MKRRSFVKMTAGAALLGALPRIAAPSAQTKAWPKTVYFDNPIGNRLFPLTFVKTLPRCVRSDISQAYFGKCKDILKYTAHEGTADAVLFRGIEIKPVNPRDLENRKFLDLDLNIWVDGYRVAMGGKLGTFTKSGGRPLPLHNPANSYICLYATHKGWLDKDGPMDEDTFAGYFLPNETCLSVSIGGFQESSGLVDVIFDMARYTTKTNRRSADQ